MTIAITNTSVSPDDLKWVLEPSYGTEANTFYVHTNAGYFLLLQIVYSTMGFSPNVQISCRYYGPDNSKQGHQTNVSGSYFRLSEDRLSVTCDPMAVKFDPVKSSYKVTLSSPSPIIADFTFEAVDGFFQVNNGKVLFKEDDPSYGYISSQFIPKGRVTGSIVVKGKVQELDGTGLFVKAIQVRPQNPARWNFTNFQSENDSLMMYQFEMPEGYGYTVDTVNYGSLVLNNKIVAVTVDNFAKQHNAVHDPWSGYDVPTEMEYMWSGQAKDGRPLKIHMKVPLKNLREKVDLLSELPYLLRTFIQTFLTSPFLYQWLEDVEVEVSLGDEKKVLKGRLFHEATFLAALPK
ncbi:putative cell survival pathways protein [Borealophlyctis nickersoniae]|nr:putative cell survival pathways protein [Borealophlyctis nickersoniae]